MAAACAKGASCTFSPNPPQCKYDVFLSFRGVDTHHNFTSPLLAALERHGFRTFKDDTGLNRGEYISTEQLKAIEESRISIVILSKNYAGSRWCLDELVKIMECKKTLQQIVMPIFYDVDPSDVRAQNGSNLVEEFAKHEEHFKEGSDGKLDKWREALTEVANLSCWNLPMVVNGDETKLIQKSIEEVRKRLDFAHLHVADHQVGLESHLQKLNLLLNMESHDVRIVAVWGIGGIGKTTIAKKLYNLIQHNFEGSSFIANVGETSKQPNGLDVACFFLRRDRDFTITVLEGCNFFPAIGIRVLADRCLIKYEPTSKHLFYRKGTSKQLVMHDLLRDMGREIVRQESIEEPGRRSRLWYHEDVLEVLREGTGTEAVEGLVLNFPELNGVQVNAKAFEKMNRMRILNLNYVHLSVGYEHISRRLVWLCWNGFPLKHVPSN